MSDETRFRAGANGYIVWTIIFGGMLLLTVHAAVTKHPSFWQAAALFAAALAFAWICLAAMKVTITRDELIFRTLFREQRMRHADIALIRLAFDPSHNGGPLRLFVDPKPSAGVEPMSINAKVLPSHAVRAVLELGERVAGTPK